MHIHVDQKLQIGIVTHLEAKSLLEEGAVPPVKVSKFYKGVRSFFETAVEYYPMMMQFKKMLDLSTSSNKCKHINFRLSIS